MDINYCIGVLIIVVEMVDFLNHEVFKLISEVGVELVGPEVVKVGAGGVPPLKYAGLLDGCEVFFDYSFHAFVVDGTVGSQKLSIGGMAVHDL